LPYALERPGRDCRSRPTIRATAGLLQLAGPQEGRVMAVAARARSIGRLLDRLALLVLGTALFGFTNERLFSHPIPEARSDMAVALAAFLFLLLVASRTRLPSWSFGAALLCAVVVEALAAFRIGGPAGGLLVALAIAIVPRLAARLDLPAPVLLASLAANYPLLRALADVQHASPLPPAEAVVAIAVPVLALPFAIADRERRLLRWGIWLIGVGMLSLLTERYFMRSTSVLAPDDVALTVGGAVLVAYAARAQAPRLARALAATGVAAVVLVALLVLQGASYTTDSAISVDEAARAMLRNENPFVAVDIVAAARARGLGDEVFTRREDQVGVQRGYPYPAGSFLPSTALYALGATDVRYGFIAVFAILCVALITRAPPAIAPYIAAIALVDMPALRHVAVAGIDPSWALLLLLSFALPLGGAFAGLAASARQTAWLYLPWIALDRARDGPAALSRWLALAAAAFFASNVVFAVESPTAWLAGVTAPFIAPYEPLGSGLVRFSIDGPLPLLPRAAYTVATLAAVLLSLWTYWRHRASWQYGLALLPVAPLYVAWRSLDNYFIFAPLLLLALLAADRDAAG
jgi:hypothetical protein